MDSIECFTNHGEDAFNSLVEGAIESAAGGELVAASAEVLGDDGNVDGAFGSQADADAAFGELAKKNSGLDTDNSKSVIDDALAVFVGCAGTGHVLVGDGDPGKRTFAREA